jgi:hypothetical protein
VEQTVIAELLITLPLPPHVPITHADDLGCLIPRDFLRHGRKITSCTFIARSIAAFV